MIVMNLVLDNIRSFEDFKVNFSYPRKVAGSTIDNEYLDGFPNFRYKKLNIIMGANATGKTALGKTLMDIFNFIYRNDVSRIIDSVNNTSKKAYIEMDFIPQKQYLYRISLIIDPLDNDDKKIDVKVALKKTKITKKDNYERCAKRLTIKDNEYSTDLAKALRPIESFGWYFIYPYDVEYSIHLPDPGLHSIDFSYILENIFKVLDPSIESVEKNEIKNDKNNAAYSIKFKNSSKVPLIHDGEITKGDFLSSGTKSGIKIATLLSAIFDHRNGFFYCDELFSYIQTDIEKAVLSVMISQLNGIEQLFFTSHNTDLLDMDLPKHSFLFLRKRMINNKSQIEAFDASLYLKKGTESLRNAVENDIFNTIPNLDQIYKLEKLCEESNE